MVPGVERALVSLVVVGALNGTDAAAQEDAPAAKEPDSAESARTAPPRNGVPPEIRHHQYMIREMNGR